MSSDSTHAKMLEHITENPNEMLTALAESYDAFAAKLKALA